MGFLGALVVVGVVGAIIWAFSRGGGGYEELPPRVVDTPTAGSLDDAEAAGFARVAAEVTELTVALLTGLEETAQLLEEGRSVEAAERFAELDEALEHLPEVASQGDEFVGGSKEPQWWAEHVRELAERLSDIDERGKIASGEGGRMALGATTTGTRILGEIALATEDFARRMLGYDLEARVKQVHGKAAARLLRAALDEAKERVG